jgi:hypothetical protein
MRLLTFVSVPDAKWSMISPPVHCIVSVRTAIRKRAVFPFFKVHSGPAAVAYAAWTLDLTPLIYVAG